MKKSVNKKINIAILGSGNIALDLLVKAEKSPYLHVVLISGRDEQSEGLAFAASLGVKTFSNSMEAIIKNRDAIDLVFDATSAASHLKNAQRFDELGMDVIDMTPSKLGQAIVPEINLDEAKKYKNVNMVTCGGQACIPLIDAISKIHGVLEYVEVVSTISSKSAGMATRENISEYIDVTKSAIEEFCGVKNAKTILIVNPAQPCINMQVSIKALVKEYKQREFIPAFNAVVRRLQEYIPGYGIVIAPLYEEGILTIMISVNGAGDYLPAYAGNLDIITCSAIYVAENLAQNKETK
ncbi:acetaldehyde dehydrogenase (acetylating) [bacterium]|nr:acetaldehyde dehydrogenase (acetylating) [bacterium]MBU1994485.1 acetaldehyde dehydrogenase (acetylating) [bacterium]